MGLFRSIGSGLAFPFTRAYRDIAGSAKGMRQSYLDMLDARQRKHEDYEAAKEALGSMSESEKFAKIYELNGWDEVQLLEQAKAAGRTRVVLLCAAAAGLVIVVGLLWIVKWWVMMILGPVAVVYFAACAALAVKFAWYEYQIETRRIMPIGAFLARPDLFARVVG